VSVVNIRAGKWLALHAGTSGDVLVDKSALQDMVAASGIAVERWLAGIEHEMGVLLGAILITHVEQ